MVAASVWTICPRGPPLAARAVARRTSRADRRDRALGQDPGNVRAGRQALALGEELGEVGRCHRRMSSSRARPAAPATRRPCGGPATGRGCRGPDRRHRQPDTDRAAGGPGGPTASGPGPPRRRSAECRPAPVTAGGNGLARGPWWDDSSVSEGWRQVTSAGLTRCCNKYNTREYKREAEVPVMSQPTARPRSWVERPVPSISKAPHRGRDAAGACRPCSSGRPSG